jgi:hypothetical protein
MKKLNKQQRICLQEQIAKYAGREKEQWFKKEFAGEEKKSVYANVKFHMLLQWK